MTTNPTTLAPSIALKGGEFVVKDTEAKDVFIPEEFNEDQLMIRDTVTDFVEQEVKPAMIELEKGDYDLALKLFQKAAELGLLGTHMPEEFGGLALDTNTNTLICDAMGASGSFNTTFAAHTGIGMLPILYFGTEEQKEKYLPGMIDGSLPGAYCLTEPSSGSDALAAKTRADLTEDGDHYLINGQKMWISNAGFAEVFILFAQIDGDKFTGFVVDKGTPGLTLGAEEKKLGIKGSSTRQVFFENMKVHKSQILGEIGKGHLIAFNALNNGRFKLCAMSLGSAKDAITSAVNYANERIQFKVPISKFGAIQYKLAEMTARTFAVECATYRVSDLMQNKKAELQAKGADFGEAKLKSAEEYAVECAILKVAGSECTDYVMDENLQIHGGMGYSEEGSAARLYRDARIARIYEGTNEINRLLTVDMLLKRAMKGKIDLVGPAWNVQKELASMPSFEQPEGTYGNEYKAVKDFKKVLLMVAGAAAKMQMDGQLNLKMEQMVVTNIADIMIDLLICESLLLRVDRLNAMDKKPAKQEVYDAILKTYIADAEDRIRKNAKDALMSFSEGDLLKTFLMGLKRFTKYPAVNVRDQRRIIANAVIDANKYCL